MTVCLVITIQSQLRVCIYVFISQRLRGNCRDFIHDRIGDNSSYSFCSSDNEIKIFPADLIRKTTVILMQRMLGLVAYIKHESFALLLRKERYHLCISHTTPVLKPHPQGFDQPHICFSPLFLPNIS